MCDETVIFFGLGSQCGRSMTSNNKQTLSKCILPETTLRRLDVPQETHCGPFITVSAGQYVTCIVWYTRSIQEMFPCLCRRNDLDELSPITLWFNRVWAKMYVDTMIQEASESDFEAAGTSGVPDER